MKTDCLRADWCMIMLDHVVDLGALASHFGPDVMPELVVVTIGRVDDGRVDELLRP